jgi:hypothetical protein
MQNRYKKPARPPNPAFLEGYLRDAQPTLSERAAEPDATEARRVDAMRALLALARRALVSADDWCNMTDGGWQPEPMSRFGAIPRPLRQFLTIAGLRILTADDPVVALRHVLGQKDRPRGAPVQDLDYRNRTIAADVAELHANGMTLDAAYRKVSKRPGTPGPRGIERVYLRLRDDLAVRADLELRRASAGNPAPEIEGIEIKEITPEQWKEYSELVAAHCPQGMTVEDNLELWGFVRRACLPR